MPVKEPGEGEILIRVRNAGVNPFDLAVMAGYLAAWFENRFPLIPGRDASGTVERVGPGVTAFAPGDEVVGSDARAFAGEGTYAEFSVLPIAAVCRRPDRCRRSSRPHSRRPGRSASSSPNGPIQSRARRSW